MVRLFFWLQFENFDVQTALVTHPFLYRQATSLEDAVTAARRAGRRPARWRNRPTRRRSPKSSADADVARGPPNHPETRDRIDGTDDGGVRIRQQRRASPTSRASPLIAANSFPRLCRRRAIVVGDARVSVTWGRSAEISASGRAAGISGARFSCLKNGGPSCPADGRREPVSRDPRRQDQCYAVRIRPIPPSRSRHSMPPVEIASSGGRRTVPIGEFYALAERAADRETAMLNPGEFVYGVTIPAGTSVGGHAALSQADAARRLGLRARQRAPPASGMDGDDADRARRRCTASVARQHLGGGGRVAREDRRTRRSPRLPERALYDAKPMSKNGYRRSNLPASPARARCIGEFVIDAPGSPSAWMTRASPMAMIIVGSAA